MIPTPDLVEQCARIADHGRAIAESEALDADTRAAAAVLTGRCLALAGRTLDDIERAEGASETGGAS